MEPLVRATVSNANPQVSPMTYVQNHLKLMRAILITIGCGACTTQQTIEPPANSSGIESKTLRFALAADGLPRDGHWKGAPVFADVNADGYLDLAAHRRLGDGAGMWLGDGQGRWTDVSQGLVVEDGSCGGGLDLADINRDGHVDLAVADHCSGAYVFLGDGRGRWQLTTAALNPAIAQEVPEDDPNPFIGAEHLAVGDVDRDGFLDLVVSASDRGGFAVQLGDGTGTNWIETGVDGLPSAVDPENNDIQRGGWANKFLLQDIDGDGIADVAATYYAGPRVWRGDGNGRWQPWSNGLPTPIIGGLFWGIAAGDINQDGRVDLLVGNRINGPEVFLQNSGGWWQRTPDVLPSMRGGALAVALGDLDGDGDLDMVVGGRMAKDATSRYGLFVLRGDGRGGWTELETGLPRDGLEVTWGIAMADVNNDRRLDVAVTMGGVTGKRAVFGKKQVAGQPEDALPHVQVWLNQTGTTP